jgi:EAL domain-containing protein (putative c-di-GMP-specific phosphodiesterase class I)
MGTVVDSASVESVIARGQISSVYQPVVDLDSGVVVAYEALARGPAGSPPERPDASSASRRHPFGANDPGTSTTCSRRPRPGRDVIVEFTERDLVQDPVALLHQVRRIRELGFGIAVDDLGAHPASLALLPFLAPDVIKLDLSLVQYRTNADRAAIAGAVLADAERRGTVILAEGIETEAHLDRARLFGATLGQGWLFGRPGPLAVETTRDVCCATGSTRAISCHRRHRGAWSQGPVPCEPRPRNCCYR